MDFVQVERKVVTTDVTKVTAAGQGVALRRSKDVVIYDERLQSTRQLSLNDDSAQVVADEEGNVVAVSTTVRFCAPTGTEFGEPIIDRVVVDEANVYALRAGRLWCLRYVDGTARLVTLQADGLASEYELDGSWLSAPVAMYAASPSSIHLQCPMEKRGAIAAIAHGVIELDGMRYRGEFWGRLADGRHYVAQADQDLLVVEVTTGKVVRRTRLVPPYSWAASPRVAASLLRCMPAYADDVEKVASANFIGAKELPRLRSVTVLSDGRVVTLHDRCQLIAWSSTGHNAGSPP